MLILHLIGLARKVAIGMGRGSVFHLSFYVTLGLAAVCLGFAEAFFLWWIPYFVTVTGVVGYLAWKHEGRWQLTEHGANSLGIVIAFLMLGWIILQLPRSDEDVLATGLPWPAGLLPHLGPLLMVLTTVKLFRPKAAHDFWVLQVLGIMMVTLASVLAGEIEHGLWLFLYLVSLLWCLSHFCQVQEGWANLSDDARRQMPLFPPPAAEADAGRTRPRWGGLGEALVWSIMGFGLGMGLFYLAPRHTSIQWIPHKLTVAAVVRNPYGLGGGMDLNLTGKVQLSDEIVFTVAGLDARNNPVELPGDMYWRGETFDLYKDGRWYSASQTADTWPELGGPTVRTRPLSVIVVPPPWNLLPPPPPPHPSQRPEDVPGDRTYIFIRALTGPVAGLILAEPYDVTQGNGLSPHWGENPTKRSFFIYHEGADIVGMASLQRKGIYSYGQVVDLTRRHEPRRADRLYSYYRNSVLVQSPPAELMKWSRDLVERLPGLTREHLKVDEDGHILPANRRIVAQALCRHFSESGEYLYSLNRRRVDESKDPNVDFLVNVKEGHCELYASGMVMTLRGVGIPCRIVHGFRGVEKLDDESYVIRQNQAHAWVQVLSPIPKSGDKSESERTEYEWIQLDPTPSQEVQLDRWQLFCEWAGQQLRRIRGAFHNGVVDFGSEQQRATWLAWWESASRFGDPRLWLAGLAMVLIGWRVVGRKALGDWKKRSGRPAQASWLRKTLAVLRRNHGLTLAPNQTLLEFAEAARTRLPAASAAALDGIARLANQVAFGGQPLSTDDRLAVAGHLAVLQADAK